MSNEYLFEPLDKRLHDRAAFSCGVEPLDKYFQEHARKDMDNHIAVVMVRCVNGEQPKQVVGYYALSNHEICYEDLPQDLNHRISRHKTYPATLMGRLAVDSNYRNQGHGEKLLYHALYSALKQSNIIASMAFVVDAKDDRARSFYEHHHFLRFEQNGHRLYLPMKTIQKMFTSAAQNEGNRDT